MNNCGIYLITCLPTGKVYVGSSCNLLNRIRSHKTALVSKRHPNKHLQCAWNSYGEDEFIFEIIEKTSIKQLSERESFWLEAHDAANRLCGFNRSTDTTFALRGYTRTPQQYEHLVKDWKFVNPIGRPIKFKNLRKFGRDNNLFPECLWAVHTGKIFQYKGWRKFSTELVDVPFKGRDFKSPMLKTNYIIVGPNSREYRTNDLASFCKKHNLNRASIAKTVTKARTSCYGWIARKDTGLLVNQS